MTETEAKHVKYPFAKNQGEQWDLKTIKKYVDIGMKKIEEDSEKNQIIVNSFKKIGGK
ncbi:MAG: hypothetical protein HQK77_21595 [Desulfobacterales bacterium]|nr:hypothetical protein [Desulfobacterales bacterium]